MKSKMIFCILVCLALLHRLPLASAQPQSSPTVQTEIASSQNITTEDVQKVARLLMSPCCWSGTADAHTSQVAYDMRAQIRAALAQGRTEKEILQAYVAQYGERILAKPTKQGFNLIAWVLPLVAIALGGFVWWRFLRRNVEVKHTPRVAANEMNDPYVQRLEKELQEFDR